ncbi:MAG: hypothetical protein MHMPM18_003994 [Marteilia pararefringens]
MGPFDFLFNLFGNYLDQEEFLEGKVKSYYEWIIDGVDISTICLLSLGSLICLMKCHENEMLGENIEESRQFYKRYRKYQDLKLVRSRVLTLASYIDMRLALIKQQNEENADSSSKINLQQYKESYSEALFDTFICYKLAMRQEEMERLSEPLEETK